MEAKRYQPAIQQFDKVLLSEPKNTAAQREKGKAVWHLGRRTEAAAIFEALFAEPGELEPQAYEDYARLLSSLPPQNVSAAIEVLDCGVRRLGPAPGLITLVVDLEGQLKRWDAALRHIDATIASAPRKDHWWRRRGEILLQAARPCAAAAAFKAGLASIATLNEDVQRTPMFQRAASELSALLKTSEPRRPCSVEGGTHERSGGNAKIRGGVEHPLGGPPIERAPRLGVDHERAAVLLPKLFGDVVPERADYVGVLRHGLLL